MALRPSTKADFLALWRSVLPPEYTEAIETEAESAGLDVPSLQAAIWAGFEHDLNVSQQAYFLRAHSIQTGATAASGAKARTTLQLYRAAPALGNLTVTQGQIFLAVATDSLGGSLSLGRFLAVASVVLPAGSSGPVAVEVEAEFEGYAGNVWDGVIESFEPQGRLSVSGQITAVGEVSRSATTSDLTADQFNTGLVGRMIRFVPLATLVTPDAGVPRLVTGTYEAVGQVVLQFSPPLLAGDLAQQVSVEVEEMEDLGVSVTQPDPAIGGRLDALQAVAEERKASRFQNETDEQFADRMVELPDTVSPGAIERILALRLDPYGIPWCLHETGDVDELMGFVWDLHPWDRGSACDCANPEPEGSVLVGNGVVWLSDSTATRFFLVCVTNTYVEQFGFGWDSPDTSTAYPAAWGLGIWEGYDVGFSEAIDAAYDAVDAARMAGVGFAIVLNSSP